MPSGKRGFQPGNKLRLNKKPPNFNDLSNQKFGRLLALSDTKKRYRGEVIWLCQCECGNTIEVRAQSLRGKHTKSCGCLPAIVSYERNFKHGGSRSKLYHVWSSMKTRCYNSTDKNYRYYGARGINVCDEWQEFPPFKLWASISGYKFGLTIDRINNDGNYEPSNCQWITQSENSKKMNEERRRLKLKTK